MESEHQEIELKLELKEDIYSALLEEFPRHKEVLQDNWFFDSQENTLNRELWGFRLRFEAHKTLITAKGPAEKESAIQIRPEYEEEISKQAGQALLKGFQLSEKSFLPCRELLKRFGDLSLHSILNFQNSRSYCVWDEIVLELDKCTIGDACWFELEVEMQAGQQEVIHRTFENLFREHGWEFVFSSTNKFHHALTLQRQHG